MYFLSEEERKYLLRGLVPRSRALAVAEEHRGWNWHQPPLDPPYGVRLGVYEVAGRYCATGRDVYLRRVRGLRGEPNPAMIAGGFYHAVLVEVLTRAKRLLYAHGVEGFRAALAALGEPALAGPTGRWRGSLPPDEWAEVERRGRLLWEFETSRVSARVQEVLARHPHINEDALVALAVPVVVEQRLDGTFLGLSPNLSADAVTVGEPLVMDVKFGEPRDFHRLATTGYALVIEAIHEYPVNLGCIVYADFQGDRWVVRRDFHIIDDELRHWFLEDRDEKMRLVFEEIDPGLPEECPGDCPYFRVCRGAGEAVAG